MDRTDAMCGGLSECKPADEIVQKMCDEVKSQAEVKAGTTFSQFEAKSYKTQIVEGTNYFIKVFVGGSSYVLLRLYQTLADAGTTIVQFIDIKTGVTKDEPIEYFP